MSRCSCDEMAPGTTTCQCYFTQFGFNNQFILSGNGDPSNPLMVDLLNSSWTNMPVTYVNGWSAYAGTTYDVPQWRRLIGGFIVQLRGRLLHPAAFVKGQTILTALPLLVRPARTKYFLAGSSGETGSISITNAGAITCEASASTGAQFLSLDGIHYEVS